MVVVVVVVVVAVMALMAAVVVMKAYGCAREGRARAPSRLPPTPPTDLLPHPPHLFPHRLSIPRSISPTTYRRCQPASSTLVITTLLASRL